MPAPIDTFCMSTPTTPRFRHDVRRTATLAAPLAAGHLASGLVSLVDAVVAGHHGTTTLAAVSVGAALFWLPMLAPMGTLMALPPAVSQLDGAGRRSEIGPLFRQALWLALALGALLFGLVSAMLLLAPMGIAPDIVPGVTAFLHTLRWGVPAFTLYLCMRYLSDGFVLVVAHHAAGLWRVVCAGAAGGMYGLMACWGSPNWAWPGSGLPPA